MPFDSSGKAGTSAVTYRAVQGVPIRPVTKRTGADQALISPSAVNARTRAKYSRTGSGAKPSAVTYWDWSPMTLPLCHSSAAKSGSSAISSK